jgi:hypothetical protein
VCGNIGDVNEPQFSELNKVEVNDKSNKPYVGYVIGSLFKDGRWIYKVSISDDSRKSETWDNWAPENWLTLVK